MQYLKIWLSFEELLEPLSDAEVGRLLRMMLRYVAAGELPAAFVGNEKFVWAAAKQSIDAAETKSEKMRINGSKGGRHESNGNQTKANESKEKQTKANESLKVKVKVKDKVNVKDNIQESNNMDSLKRFKPPTVEDVKAYCDERGVYLIDPQRFVDYYEVRGWLLTKNRKMVDWKAAVRLWEKNERERQKEEQYSDLPY